MHRLTNAPRPVPRRSAWAIRRRSSASPTPGSARGCVAGADHAGGSAAGSPVSARPDGELNDDEQRCTGGGPPGRRDPAAAGGYQRENHLIDPALRWTKRGAVTWNDLQAAVEDPAGPLWPNGHSSSHGLNDQVPVDLLAEQTRSLYLVRPERLEIVVMPEDIVAGPSRLRVRQFSLAGQDYRLPSPTLGSTSTARDRSARPGQRSCA